MAYEILKSLPVLLFRLAKDKHDQVLMKTKTPDMLSQLCGTLRQLIVAGLLFIIHFQAVAQSSAKKEQPEEVQTPGYLNKTAPTGLRFASPPKPPVAYLPPLPITYDPQPVFNSDYAQQVGTVPNVAAPSAPPPVVPPVIGVPWPESVAAVPSTNRQIQIPVTPIEVGAVSPQMLVRFFQNGRPADVQMLMSDPVNFRVPVREERRSSSASYEVK